jgi:hypothetical protein
VPGWALVRQEEWRGDKEEEGEGKGRERKDMTSVEAVSGGDGAGGDDDE